MTSPTISSNTLPPPDLLLSLLPPGRQAHYHELAKAVAAEAKTPQITLRDLKILDAHKNVVPLIANPPQRELMRGLKLDADDPSPDISEMRWRMRLLKARREGFSTFILAMFFLDTYNNRERLTVSVAHDQKSAETIFRIVDRYYRFLPEEKKIRTGRANTREYFWPDTGSQFLASTAGVSNLYSGGAIHNLHCSERSKWPGDAEQINALDASLKGAARWGNIIEETTANGLNFFYDDWLESKQGKGNYTALFVPWYLDDRNRSAVRSDFERTEEEQRRVDVYGVDDEQLQWYREAEEEYGELLPQEYPYSDLEAFVSSADNAYFGTQAVKWLMDYIPTLPEPVKVYECSHPFDDHPSGALHGELRIFEQPISLAESRLVHCPCGLDFDGYAKYTEFGVAICPECGREHYPAVQYVAGADACGGIGGMTESNVHDWSSFVIYRVRSWGGDWGWKQVAAYHGRPTPRDYGEDMVYIGKHYNNCEILVENDPRGYGLQAMERMRELEYPNLRHYNPGSRMERVIPPEKQRWGYMVSEKGQQRRDELFRASVRDVVKGREGIVIQDERAIREMVAYVDKGDGKRGAGRGHDDCVTAHGLANLLLRSVTGGAI